MAKPTLVKNRVIASAWNGTKRMFKKMVNGIKNSEIKDSLFHVNRKLKDAWKKRDEIHWKIRPEKIGSISNSYTNAAAEFFFKTHKKEQEPQKHQKEQERNKAILKEVVSSYQTKELISSWSAQKKLSELGLDTNSTSGLFATTQTMLVIITYLKNAPSYQDQEFINQAYEFILATHGTADCINEYRKYRNDIIIREIEIIAGSLSAAGGAIFAMNTEALIAGALLAVLSGTVTAGILLAAALVIIIAVAIGIAVVNHEKKQLQKSLTTALEDKSINADDETVGNISKSMMSKQKEMLGALQNIQNNIPDTSDYKTLWTNLNTVLAEVQAAEESFAPVKAVPANIM